MISVIYLMPFGDWSIDTGPMYNMVIIGIVKPSHGLF